METMLFAEAPETCCGYLTPWKQYKVDIDYGDSFTINDDSGQVILCFWKGCSHAEGDWKKIEVKIDKENEKVWDIVLSSKVLHPDDSRKMETLEIQSNRYEALRKLTPAQFTELYKMNISTGIHFDTLVDMLITGELKV